jgi:hypothetical protein
LPDEADVLADPKGLSLLLEDVPERTVPNERQLDIEVL